MYVVSIPLQERAEKDPERPYREFVVCHFSDCVDLDLLAKKFSSYVDNFTPTSLNTGT
jgi:hypothetical protein